jgi:hypothetical protein
MGIKEKANKPPTYSALTKIGRGVKEEMRSKKRLGEEVRDLERRPSRVKG